ncbi:Hypothetical protein PBC10988_9600 [Planctomycetales bacterium 10988]|nr:Hypothetical protein PBC10988_9600 [Planctomycetales bacterium 10988]
MNNRLKRNLILIGGSCLALYLLFVGIAYFYFANQPQPSFREPVTTETLVYQLEKNTIQDSPKKFLAEFSQQVLLDRLKFQGSLREVRIQQIDQMKKNQWLVSGVYTASASLEIDQDQRFSFIIQTTGEQEGELLFLQLGPYSYVNKLEEVFDVSINLLDEPVQVRRATW